MPILNGQEQERQGIMETANLMVVPARTAPKSGGVDDILTAIVYGEEVKTLAADMEKIAVERKFERWSQQAREIKTSEVVVLIGVRGTKRYVNGSPTIQPLTAGPHLRPARLAKPMMTGARINFKTRMSIGTHIIYPGCVCQIADIEKSGKVARQNIVKAL